MPIVCRDILVMTASVHYYIFSSYKYSWDSPPSSPHRYPNSSRQKSNLIELSVDAADIMADSGHIQRVGIYVLILTFHRANRPYP